MNPANISFDNPNDSPTNYPASVPTEQPKEIAEPNADKNTDSSKKPNTSEIFTFLNTKTLTILTFSIAVAIGLALKDFMNALVHNILQPSLMKTIMYFDSNNYLPITQSLRNKEVSIDVAKFLGNMLVLKLVIGSMYFIYKYSEVLL
jgi:large-conductance mechanosensitive channel